MSAIEDPEEVGWPLLERGDFVRLKQPYEMTESTSKGVLKAALNGVVRARERSLRRNGASDLPKSVRGARNHAAFEDIFTFTHGTVVEVIDRYRWELATQKTNVQNEYDPDANPPPKRVSLHLYNPATGIMYAGGHPIESGKPEFVDHHVGELILVHKATESWGNEYGIDIADALEEWEWTCPDLGEEEADAA